MLNGQSDLKLEIEEIKKKLNNQDKNIELVFSYLDELIEKKEIPQTRKRIGYMPDELSASKHNPPNPKPDKSGYRPVIKALCSMNGWQD